VAELSFIPSIVSALSGLAGVWFGGHLTSKREAQKEQLRTKADATYLAILVGAHLDGFVDRCIAVSFDDGTEEGRPAGDDGIGHAATERTPVFDPLSLNVEWKSLPSDLMYGILNLPYKVEQLNRFLAPISEDDYPDYSEYFWERQVNFAQLGLDVLNLNSRLRNHAGLPAPDVIPRQRSRQEILEERVFKVGLRLAPYRTDSDSTQEQ